MSRPELKHPGYTIEDWKLWEGRWELINGVAYDMTPAPSLEHQRISSKLHLAIGNALEAAKQKSDGGECELFSAPVDVFLGDAVVQPDLVVACDPAKKSARGIEGAPDLVVEILSPATASKDLTGKWWLNEAAGVPEYLIEDPDERVGKLLSLEAGRYVEKARVEWGTVVALLGGKISLTLG